MPATYLTKDGFQKLQDELEYLRTVKRQEVAERLHEAMEGRIQEVEMILAAAHIIDDTSAHNDPTLVQVGDTVVIQEDKGDPEEYVIVGAAEADPRSGKISNESPLGKALLNHRPGDVVTVDAPGGSFKVKVLKTT